MRHRHGSAAEVSRDLGSRSDRFLAAAEHLPLDREDMSLPRLLLLRVAVEHRLKAYICAARGGAPQTRDLYRLAGLAIHCGLSLSKEQLAIISLLDRGELRLGDEGDSGASGTHGHTASDTQPMTSRLMPSLVRTLCEAIVTQETTESSRSGDRSHGGGQI